VDIPHQETPAALGRAASVLRSLQAEGAAVPEDLLHLRGDPGLDRTVAIAVQPSAAKPLPKATAITIQVPFLIIPTTCTTRP
jgi:hypothetical protein